MPLQEPRGQVTAEIAGPLLTLLEPDNLIRILGIEQQIKSGGSLGEKALAGFLTATIGSGLAIVRNSFSGWSRLHHIAARIS